MSLINTGMQRATAIIVDKKVGGSSLSGYPHIYNLGDAFSNFPPIPKNELAKIPIVDYQIRLASFRTHVESVEIGVVINIDDAYKENLEACPI